MPLFLQICTCEPTLKWYRSINRLPILLKTVTQRTWERLPIVFSNGIEGFDILLMMDSTPWACWHQKVLNGTPWVWPEFGLVTSMLQCDCGQVQGLSYIPLLPKKLGRMSAKIYHNSARRVAHNFSVGNTIIQSRVTERKRKRYHPTMFKTTYQKRGGEGRGNSSLAWSYCDRYDSSRN